MENCKNEKVVLSRSMTQFEFFVLLITVLSLGAVQAKNIDDLKRQVSDLHSKLNAIISVRTGD